MTGDQGQREIGHPPHTGPSLADRIRDLHRIRTPRTSLDTATCWHCHHAWPCTTVRVVDAHEKVTDR